MLLAKISSHPSADALLSLPGLLVESIHKFQGDERDVMVFSPVAAQGLPEGASRFLRRTAHLCNVAITRARSLLVIVGDPSAGALLEIPHLAALADYAAGLGPAEPQAGEAPLPAGGDPESVSPIETELSRLLVCAGLRPLPQYPAGGYRIDLAILQSGRRLAIEVDGEAHHRGWDGELLRADQIRMARLQDMGWDVMRFWAAEVRDRPEWCVGRVRDWAAPNLLFGKTNLRHELTYRRNPVDDQDRPAPLRRRDRQDPPAPGAGAHRQGGADFRRL